MEKPRHGEKAVDVEQLNLVEQLVLITLEELDRLQIDGAPDGIDYESVEATILEHIAYRLSPVPGEKLGIDDTMRTRLRLTLDELCTVGLVEVVKNGNGTSCYHLTARGQGAAMRAIAAIGGENGRLQ